MPLLSDYHEFAGRHYETGTVRNALAYQGLIMPHTGAPISEALLMGISGGVTFGYFTFEYQGYPPHIALLTRNTFDLLESLFNRLALPHEVFQTHNPAKATVNLLDVLESGRPALVWVDMFSLAYNDLPVDAPAWGMIPVLVYGYQDGIAYLADRANCSIQVDADALEHARARIKKEKFRVIALDKPDLTHLADAVSKGIRACISLYTEAPPKGKRDNFGLAALKSWAKLLTNTRNKQSWERYFPAGQRLWMAVVGNQIQPGAFSWIRKSNDNSAERGMYADFLDEAGLILGRPGLKDAALQFRNSQKAWTRLADNLLPDDIPVLKEAKELLTQKHDLFIAKGAHALDEIQTINQRLNDLRQSASENFPMNASQVRTWRESLAEQVLTIHDIEDEAVDLMQAAMAEK